MQRRKFIRNSAITAAAVPGVISGFNITAHAESILPQGYLLPGTPNDHVLVVIQMSGGNDGLNTVVPLDQYSSYFNARPNVAIAENRVLPITGTAATGLHPALSGFRDLYNEGKLCIVQGVGYPNPSYSHFRATDIWHSASNSDQFLTDGWLGRYLNGEYPGYPTGYPNAQNTDPLAIQFGASAAFSLLGPTAQMAYTISNLASVASNVNDGDVVPNDTPMGDQLDYLRTVSKQAEQYSAVIQAAYSRTGNNNLTTYPSTTLASQLKVVARLINGGLKTKIYVVNIKGFDTHNNQVVASDTSTGSHALLLSTISDAVKSFQADLALMNKDQRVLGMTFSEFGRRIKSNNGLGTDHGYAAPMFIFGAKATGGILGTNPLLPVNASVNDNLDMQHDFRSVYFSLMKRWLCQDSTSLQQILLQNFADLDICNNGDCAPLGRPDMLSAQNFVTAAPNPSASSTTLSFKTNGGHTLLQLVTKEGLPVETLIEANYGGAQVINKTINLSPLKAGMYYIRFQNGTNVQMKPIIKLP